MLEVQKQEPEPVKAPELSEDRDQDQVVHGLGLAHLGPEDLQGRVLACAMDGKGCRFVQRAFDLADDKGRILMAQELRGHVQEALESPHANYVLQRAVELMRPSSVSFVLDELISAFCPVALAKHRYGCRVLERLIEHFPPEKMGSFLAPIIEESLELSKHIYGNFVVQHVLEHGELAQRQRIADLLLTDLPGIALDQHACSVLDKALSYGLPQDQARLAMALLDQELLVGMAKMRGSLAATQRLFRILDGSLLLEAKRQLG